MKLAALVSGGKDGLYAAYLAGKRHEIRVIVAIKSRNPESYMYHVPNIGLVKLQAETMRIPLIFRESEGKKEEELEDLKAALAEAKAQYGIEGVVSGAIYSKYQKERVDRICTELGLESLAPLWKRNPQELWHELFDTGFEAIVVTTKADLLGKEWLGRTINEEFVVDLRAFNSAIDPCGEFGEFHSFVIDGPLFKNRIELGESEPILEDGYWRLDISDFAIGE
jgi:diphthine-ammonia ligase